MIIKMYKEKSLEEIFLKGGGEIKNMDSVRVLYMYEDSHSLSYMIEYVVEGKRYVNFDVRCGDLSRMYYQAEISEDIRDNVLKPYIQTKILESLTYVDL